MGKEILRNGGGNHGEGQGRIRMQGANRTQGLRAGLTGRRGEGRGADRAHNAKKAGYYARIVDVKKPCNCRALMGYLIAVRAIFCTS